MVRGKGQRFCHYGLTKGGNSMMLIMVGYVPLGKRKKKISRKFVTGSDINRQYILMLFSRQVRRKVPK